MRESLLFSFWLDYARFLNISARGRNSSMVFLHRYRYNLYDDDQIEEWVADETRPLFHELSDALISFSIYSLFLWNCTVTR
jgi:hypothetical protein